MCLIFKNALVRKPSKNIANAISSKGLKPDYNKVIIEHQNYINALKHSNLQVNILKSNENSPDSVFVEDPAITYNEFCIILRSKIKSRFNESKDLSYDINNSNLFEKIFFVEKGFIEGGDILRIENHFIIGLSKRTDIIGAQSLSELLTSLGCTVEISKTPNNVLHFKSDCSLIDIDTILITKKMFDCEALKKFNLVEIPSGEELSANTLRINKNLIMPKGFKKTEEILTKKYNIKVVDVTEISKVDAGLSCMSLRW